VNVLQCNREEYIYLLMFTRQWLIEQRYFILAAMITSGVKPRAGRRQLNKGKLVTEIIQSRSYATVLSKYSLVKEKIEENKSIITLIGDMLNTEFLYVPGFKGSPDLEHHLNVEDNPKLLISEVLSFLERL